METNKQPRFFFKPRQGRFAGSLAGGSSPPPPPLQSLPGRMICVYLPAWGSALVSTLFWFFAARLDQFS